MAIVDTILVIDAEGTTREVRTLAADSATGAAQIVANATLQDISDYTFISNEITLLTATNSTGSGSAVQKGSFAWTIYGTFDSATATLQYSPDSGTTWISVIAATDAKLYGGLDLLSGQARVAISGAGGSTSLSSKIGGI